MVRLRSPAPYGGFPERPKGADCKSVVTDFGGPNPPSPTNRKAYCNAVGFFVGEWIDGEATDARTKQPLPLPLCWWFLPPSVARMWSRIHHPPPEKSTCESKCFFQLSVPLARNVKCPSDEKCASRVKCAFGTIQGTIGRRSKLTTQTICPSAHHQKTASNAMF